MSCILNDLTTVDDLRRFMSWHVFVVWSYMNFVKRLQYEYTSMNLPWTPSERPVAAYAVNNIVLHKENGMGVNKEKLSSFDIYVSAMKEMSIDITQVDYFISLIGSNIGLNRSLKLAKIPDPLKSFMTIAIDKAIHGDVCTVIGWMIQGADLFLILENLLTRTGLDKKYPPNLDQYLDCERAFYEYFRSAFSCKNYKNYVRDSERNQKMISSSIEEASKEILGLWSKFHSTMGSKVMNYA